VDPLVIVPLVIVVALFFDFTNGFHDTANAMATPIATGAFKPKTAVAVAAVMNLVGAFISTAVATNISKDMVIGTIDPAMVFAALTGAIVWNLVTWLFGLPSSSSHALFGGLVGAALVFPTSGVDFGKVLAVVLIPALFSPLIAGVASALGTLTSYVTTGRSESARTKNGIATGRAKFKYGQVFSSSLLALSHGTNDAQKTMGIITLALVAGFPTIYKGDHVEFWVILAAGLAIAVGTYMGGWRIIKTMGQGLSEIRPAQGFSAETAAGATVLASSFLGFSLSTTQVTSGAVIGAGLGRKGALVKWNKAGQIVLGWLVTLPAAAIVGALSAWLITSFGVVGLVLDGIILLVAIAGIMRVNARNKVNHKSVAPSEVEVIAQAIKSPRQVRKEAAKAAKAKKGKK
jgi:PiT family inorganic phosphate transporter